ncbi:MAG: AAA family ATPase [Neisseriaceae bacterium]|nr:AAA family ATPase [Neisseriaceae bacterium]
MSEITIQTNSSEPEKIPSVQISKINSSEPEELEELCFFAGTTTIIVGANGTGKTRLAAYVEKQLGEKAHRIAAHRALALNPNVPKIPEEHANIKLKILGGVNIGNSDYSKINYGQRNTYRSRDESATHLLNDFDALLQCLFAQQCNLSVEEHKKQLQGKEIKVSKTHFDKLKEVWEILLPRRKLRITADNIQVSITGDENPNYYSASEMSDGERAIFYILGQVLCANENTVLIFDEPELHIHQSIIANLWDKIEELRPDCAFLVITHDIAFASNRIAEKYVIRDYCHNSQWDIAKVPESNFDEQTITMILGSRKPILFVEGTSSSLDMALYRACYPEWTIIPRESCSAVIHAVSSMKKLLNDMPLLRLQCAGIVDKDGKYEHNITALKKDNIFTLPVAEIENIFALTDIAKEILKLEEYQGQDLENKLSDFQTQMIKFITGNSSKDKLDKLAIKIVRRRIDYRLKKVDLSSSHNAAELKNQLSEEIKNINIDQDILDITNEINSYSKNNELNGLLTIYENKGIFPEIGVRLRGNNKKDDFEKWLCRVLNNKDNKLVEVIRQKLPKIEIQS